MKLFAVSLFFTLQLAGQVGWITIDPPAGLVGVAYSFQLQASSAQGSLTYSLPSGTLPAGITMSSGGFLSGTTTQSGTFTFTARAAVSASVFSDRLFRLLIVSAPPPVTFFPTEFPSGSLGLAYQASFSAIGVLGEMQFSILSGVLPAGLRMERESGASVRILGTPTVAGRYDFSLRTIDSFGVIKDFNFTIVITGTLLKILPDTVPVVTVGIPYEVQLSGEGGSAPYRFEKAGSFINYQLSTTGLLGLNLNAEGTVNLSVAMVDSLGARVEKFYSIPVSVGAIRVLTQTLPEVATYTPYEAALSIVGGLPPYQCLLVSGNLPAGLSLGQGCTVRGNAQQEGNFSFVVSVTGSQGPRAEATIRMTSRQLPLVFTSAPEVLLGPYGEFPSLYPDASLGGRQLSVQGGRPPYTFSLVNSAGPPGMKLLTNGEFFGRLKDYRMGVTTVEVVDSLGNTARQEVQVQGAGSIYPGPLYAWVPGIAGEAYWQALGRPNEDLPMPVRYSIASGALPPGLRMLSDGTVAGEPTTAGVFTFVYEMTGADGKSSREPASITITEALIRIENPYPSFAIQGQAYSGVIRAHGSGGPFQYRGIPGLLPQGLSLATDGRLQGTVLAQGTYRFPVVVTNSKGKSITAEVVLEAGGSAVFITTPDQLPDIEVGRPFQMQFSASGGSGSYGYSFVSCCPPLGIESRGLYRGTAWQPGVYEFVLAAATEGSSGRGFQLMRQVVRDVPGIPKEFPDVVMPNARRDQPYSEWLGFEGAPAYSVRPDIGLPPGLTLSANGQLSGSLRRLGTFTFPVTVEYAAQRGVRYQRLVTISVVDSGPAISGTSHLPRAMRNSAYSAVLEIGGGNAPYTAILQAGLMPKGLRLATNPSGQIVLAGEARDVGVYPFVLLVSDRTGNRNSLPFELSVTDMATPLSLDFSSVNRGIAGIAYAGAVKALGGRPPYRFELLSGNMIAGLSMDLKGNLTGIPVAAGTFRFSVLVTDSMNYRAAGFTIGTVGRAKEALTTRAVENPVALMGQVYRGELGIAGGRLPFEITITRGSLPPGLRLSGNGLIEGVVLAPGTYHFGVSVRDADGQTVAREITLIAPVPTELAAARRLAVYDGRVVANSGVAPIRFELDLAAQGGLPPGIRLLSDGRLQGIPAVTGDFVFVVRSIDSRGVTTRLPMLLPVLNTGPIAFLATSLPGGTVGQGYRQRLSVTGATGVVRYVIRDGGLPPGLKLEMSTGLIDGVAEREGSYTLMVQAIDAQNREESMMLEIVVAREGSPRLAALVNAASYEVRGIAPGELLTGFGELLGPREIAGLQLDMSGRVSSVTGGTRILVNGVALPMVYSVQSQFSAIAPWNEEGVKTVWISVERGGNTSAPYRLKTLESKPGLFTLDASGTGLAAIVNPNGSINQRGNPARRGDTIVAYLTGGGAMDVNGLPGSVASGLSRLRLPVSVSIGGVSAEVVYAGNAPGLIEGVTQLNIKIPGGSSSGPVPIRVKVGSVESMAGVLVTVE
jgi:uncharacterized protein (TIGR03437 family)